MTYRQALAAVACAATISAVFEDLRACRISQYEATRLLELALELA